MIGQGRPKASSRTYSDKVFCTGWTLGVCLGFLLLVQAVHPARATAESMRLRIAWGGSLEQLWRGTVSVVGGTLEEPRPLGIEADETGSMWIEDDRLIIRQRSPRTYDGVDLLVTASLDAALVVELAAEGPQENPARFKIPLAELVEKSTTVELDNQGSRLLIRRSPGDVLRVESPRRSLVLSPGEALPLSVQPHLLPSAQGDTVELELALVAARTSQSWWSRTQTISAAHPVAIPLEIPAPGEEGVYDLIITARQAPGLSLPRGGRVPLGWKKTLAQRKIQFVVVGSEPRGESSDNPGTLDKVVEIDPVNPKWWERFAKLPKIPGLPWQWNEPFGNGHRQVGRHALGPVVQLAPSQQASDLAWEAYPLPIDQPGVPHVLEVDYPSDVVQELGISVMEPDASGALLPIQLDSGVLRPEGPIDNPRDHSPRWNRHRLIFWPHTKSPVVLISNLQRDKPALYGKIRVLAGWNHLPRAMSRDEAPARRLFGAYFDRPLFPQSFSASEALDEWSHRSLDDWVTFHEGGTRMVEYLHHVGHGGLMLSVWADGSTLYPSDVLEPTPRYDKGAFFSTGQDPTRKDVLEMLFRLFDREGLRLIPALEFSTPLPELEALLRRGGPECVGIQWIGADGGTWQQTYSPRRGLAPYYNVLHPRVQEAMLSVVREVATIYAEHPSCAGLALQLSAWGYAQLPGPAWGMDDATIAQFERDTDIQVPGLGPDRFAQRATFLTGPQRARWLQWRCRQLSQFHRRVRDVLRSVRPDTCLYLAGATSLDGDELERQLRPTLPRRFSLSEALMQVGIDANEYRDEEGMVLLHSEQVAPLHSTHAEALRREFAGMSNSRQGFQPLARSGSLFYHPPRNHRVASFDQRSPWASYTSLLAQPALSAEENRRRFVHHLATLDPRVLFDGGWMLPMGQEETIRDIALAYGRLPAVRFHEIRETEGAADSQPVTFRFATHEGKTFAYAVNDTPFPVQARVGVQAPSRCRLKELTGRRRVAPLERDGAGASWVVELGPYDLVAVEFSEPGVELTSPKVSLDGQIVAHLDNRIRQLGARAAVLRAPPLLKVLRNPDFEQASDPVPLPGWAFSKRPGTQVQVLSGKGRNGSRGARLQSEGSVLSLVSHAFPPPPTGRLSVSVWLRVPDSEKQPPFQLALEGELHGQPYHRFAPVGWIPSLKTAPNPIGPQWQRFVLRVDDVPLDGLESLRVRFDLVGAGEVWLDDVQLYHLDFDGNEQVELAKLITLAEVKLQQGQVRDCLGLLEGYWLQFLRANVPLDEASVAQRPDARSPASPPPPREPQRSASLLERMRDLWPEKLRF